MNYDDAFDFANFGSTRPEPIAPAAVVDDEHLDWRLCST